MLKIIEDKNLCDERGVDGLYLIAPEVIVVADRSDKPVLVHEISHYLYSIGSTKYLDSIIDICALLGVDFFDVVDIKAVSEMVDDYEVMLDEIVAYFVEQVFKDFPELVLDSVPIFRIVLRGCDENE